MLTFVKILSSILVSAILLVIIAMIALPFFINANDFKPKIAAAIKHKIGRDLSIDGDIEVSIFPYIGIETGALVLSNVAGFTDKPLLKIAESHIKVELLPLLLKKIKIDHIVLKGLVLNLASDQQGNNNWSDTHSTSHTLVAEKAEQITLKINELSLTDAIRNNSTDRPNVQFSLQVETVEVDRYIHTVPQPQTGEKIITPASAMAAILFSVTMLQDTDIVGDIMVNQLKLRQRLKAPDPQVQSFNMAGLHIKLNTTKGVISAQQSIKHLYQGTYSSDIRIDTPHKIPRFTLNEKLAMVQIEPLLNDWLGESNIAGLTNIAMHMTAQGHTSDMIKSSINGNIDFNFKDGAIKGFNLQKMINQGKALIGSRHLFTQHKNDQTIFSAFSGSAKITDGLISNNNLSLKASRLRISGEGTANLLSEVIDYRITARFLKRKASDTTAEKIKGTPVIINVGGTFSNPVYTLNVATMLRQKIKQKIHKKQGDWLKKRGIDVGDIIDKLF